MDFRTIGHALTAVGDRLYHGVLTFPLLCAPPTSRTRNLVGSSFVPCRDEYVVSGRHHTCESTRFVWMQTKSSEFLRPVPTAAVIVLVLLMS